MTTTFASKVIANRCHLGGEAYGLDQRLRKK